MDKKKDIKKQIPLPLNQPPQPKPTPPTRPSDTGGKPVPAEQLAKVILQKLARNKSRKVASVAFLIYQLVEMTISLANTL